MVRSAEPVHADEREQLVGVDRVLRRSFDGSVHSLTLDHTRRRECASSRLIPVQRRRDLARHCQ